MFYCECGGPGGGWVGGSLQAGIGTAAAMQWQSQVSSLMLTVSHGLIHRSAFRTLAYIYKQLTLPVLLQSYVIPVVFLLVCSPLRTHAECSHPTRHWNSSVALETYGILSSFSRSAQHGFDLKPGYHPVYPPLCRTLKNITHNRLISSLNSCFRETETVAPSVDHPLIPSWLHARHS